MAKKPKAGGPKRKTKKAVEDKEQSERFIKTARELGVDETGKSFETVFGYVVKRSSKQGQGQ
jgi:hypothetical protein